MALSVTITHPMPQAIVLPSFSVCGTYAINEIDKALLKSPDRNVIKTVNATIQVYVTKDGTSYGPFTASFCTEGGTWEASVSGVSPEGGYTVTATITQGENQLSHSIEWVEVASSLRVRIPVTCCAREGETEEEVLNKITLFPLGTARKKVKLVGDHTTTNPNKVFAVVRLIDETKTVEQLPSGGKHYKIVWRQGDALPGKYGDLKAGKKWEVTDIEVDAETYVMIHIKNGGLDLGYNASPLF